MAIKYLIKDTLVSTEKNTNFPNKTITYWIGKDDKYGSNYTSDEKDIKRVAHWYGYSTKAAATKGLKKHKELADWETEQGFWKHVSVEIIAVEVDN